MFEKGTFSISPETSYTVYHMTGRNYDRLDICKNGASFNTEPGMVLYSRIQKRSLYVYGDRELYNSYMSFQSSCSTIAGDYDKESGWSEDHKHFIVREIKKNAQANYLEEITRDNGVIVSTLMSLKDKFLEMSYISDNEDVVSPINFNEYDKLALDGGATVKESIPYYSVNTLRARYNLAHIDKTDSVVADDLETAERRLMEWANSKETILAVDTETTGLDIDMDGEDTLVGVVLGESETKSTYFPFGHLEINNLPFFFLEKMMALVKQNEYRCTGHNVKFEHKIFLKTGGWDIRIHYDSFPLSFMLNPVNRKGAHALKGLVESITGNKYLELEEIFTSANNIKFQVLPKELVRLYACPDGYNSIVVFKELYKKLPIETRRLYEIECELTTIKAENEYYGLRVDVDKYMRNSENCNYVIDTLLKTFRALTHVDGNINSPVVLNNLLYEKMHCPVLMRTKTGRPSTSGAAIKKLAKTKTDKVGNLTMDIKDMFGKVVIKASDLNNSQYPALLVLDKYREYNKRKTAFYNRFDRTMRTGRVYFWVNQNGAGTGRQSSPMHQLPPELKDIIIADTDNHRFVDSDYSQIELRMIAFLAGEQELIDLCCDSDNDIHRVIGSLISGMEMWQIDAQMRSKGKRRNFGVVYCISEYGLAGQMFGPGYTEENVQECKGLIADFFNRFKRINRFIKANCDSVKKNGYISTYFSRYRYFKEILDPDTTNKRKASLMRQANNTPVQGTAADLLKIAECNMMHYIDEKGWNKIVDGYPLVRMALSIHDETIVMAHRSIPHEEIIEMITTCMELKIKGAPPFFVCPAFCDTWEGHNDDSLAIPVKLRDKLIADYNATGKSVFTSTLYKFDVDDETRKYVTESRYTVSVNDIYANIEGKINLDAPPKVREAAIKNYIRTNLTMYDDTNYRQILDDYRESVLVNYMDNLVQEYGPDPANVAEHVRHPSLTHELIARFSKSIPRGTDHVESINIATRCYMEEAAHIDPKDDADDKPVFERAMSESERIELFAEVERLSTFDNNGELLYEDGEGDIDEDEEFSSWDDQQYIEHIANTETVYVWRFADSIVMDVDQLLQDQINTLLAKCYEYVQENGFYKVLIYYRGKIRDTGMRVEDLPVEELQEMVKGYLQCAVS